MKTVMRMTHLKLREVGLRVDNGKTTDALCANGLVVFDLRGVNQVLPQVLCIR